MPRMDRLELVRLVRVVPECSRIPILFLRTTGNRENMLEAMKAGIDVCIVRPFSVDALKEKIQLLIRAQELRAV